MRVNIKLFHIENARAIRQGNPRSDHTTNCPLALAIEEKLGKAVHVHPTTGTVCMDKEPILHMSPRVVQWAEAFDAGKPVGPAIFQLREVQSDLA